MKKYIRENLVTEPNMLNISRIWMKQMTEEVGLLLNLQHYFHFTPHMWDHTNVGYALSMCTNLLLIFCKEVKQNIFLNMNSRIKRIIESVFYPVRW